MSEVLEKINFLNGEENGTPITAETLMALQTNIENAINKAILEDNKKKYHVGKIIVDTANVNPETYLGFGTWTYWGSGKVPVGVDTADTDFATVEKTGGNKTAYTFARPARMEDGTDAFHIPSGLGGFSDRIILSGTKKEVGTGYTTEKVSNVQPYITCYMWKRTA